MSEASDLKAAVYEALEKPAVAVRYFTEAYEMSWKNDITLPFAEHGQHTLRIIGSLGELLVEHGVPDRWLMKIRALAEQFEGQRAQMRLDYQWRNPQVALRKLELLTKTEYEALKLLCQGQTVEQIAETMGVAPLSVKDYHRRAYKKMGVQTRGEAVRIAIDEGILG